MASRKLITKEYQGKDVTTRMNPTLCSRPWLGTEAEVSPVVEKVDETPVFKVKMEETPDRKPKRRTKTEGDEE